MFKNILLKVKFLVVSIDAEMKLEIPYPCNPCRPLHRLLLDKLKGICEYMMAIFQTVGNPRLWPEMSVRIMIETMKTIYP